VKMKSENTKVNLVIKHKSANVRNCNKFHVDASDGQITETHI